MANILENDITASGSWQSDKFKWMENVNSIVNELQADHASLKTAITALRTAGQTACITPPNFELDTNFDIKNGDAFEIIVAGVAKTVATDKNFDTGTSTPIATNAYWACALLSINVDGTTTFVNWGAEAVDEAGAKTLLSAVTAGGGVLCGYVAVRAKAAEDFVAGTDALNGGSGGQVAQTTTYYNDVKVGATYDTAATSIAAPASLTNSTALKLTKG